MMFVKYIRFLKIMFYIIVFLLTVVVPVPTVTVHRFSTVKSTCPNFYFYVSKYSKKYFASINEIKNVFCQNLKISNIYIKNSYKKCCFTMT